MPIREERKLAAGHTISRTFEVFFGGFATWIGIAGICGFAVFLLGLILEVLGIQVSAALSPEAPFGDPRMPSADELIGQAVYNVLILVYAQLVAGSCCAAAAAMRAGRPVSMSESVGVAMRRFFPLFGLALLTGLVIGFTMFLCFLGLLFLTMWYVAVPALVLEERGVIDAMDRSAQLSRGTRGPVFLVVLVFILIGVVMGAVIAGMTAFASPTAAITATVVVTVLSNALGSVASIVTYLDLVELKEVRRDIADVFD